jgi:hypothetical protein
VRQIMGVGALLGMLASTSLLRLVLGLAAG